MAPTAMSRLPEKATWHRSTLPCPSFLRVYPSAGTKYLGMDESDYRDAVISRRS